jgi:RNA polymerase sigma-70 factor, ECF subfamily
MTTPSLSSTPAPAHPPEDLADFKALVQEIRPELHRYCARMIGSVVDAEDVVQEALAKAYAALPSTSVANMRGWLFRIVHNKAVDHLRRARHEQLEYLDEQALLAEPEPQLEEQEMVAVALSVFLKLAPKQRSCVILKDVMGYSLAEISELLDATIPEIKAALHRGRVRLRELSSSINVDVVQPLDEQEQRLLARYIDRFNAHDFDAVRAMLADEVRLDLVNRLKLTGLAAVGEYFHNYEQADNWYLALGTVEQRPAILVYGDRERLSQPAYFMLLTWEDGQVALIRDYRYVPYVTRDAEMEEIERC